ncbi:MAG: recombinase family protein, partial [Phototrophicaceae bacterium]
MRAVIYTRVSSAEQVEGYSLSAQREVCQRFAEFKNWQVVHTYEEPGRSGKSDMRPVFQQMMADAKRNHFDVVIVHKLDRFSRRLQDVLSYLSQLNDLGVLFASATEQFDFTTPSGRLTLSIMGAVAQWYTDNLAEEVRKSAQERHRQGHWNGILSFGYSTPARFRDALLNPTLNEAQASLIEATLEQYPHAIDTAAIPDPIHSPGVRLAFELYATGQYGYRAIADRLNAQGYLIRNAKGQLGPFGSATIRELLQNRFYLGEVSYIGYGKRGRASKLDRTWQPGAQTPIIEQELFDRCQQIHQTRLQQYRYNRAENTVYPLSGLLFDAEGIAWHGQTTHYRKYIRNFEQARKIQPKPDMLKSVKADDLEYQIYEMFSEIAVTPELINIAREELLGQSKGATVPKAGQNVEGKIARLKDLYVDGIIDRQEFDVRLKELQDVPLLSETPASYNTNDIDLLLAQLANLEDIWKLATNEERHGLLKLFFNRLVLGMVEKKVWILEAHLTALFSAIVSQTSLGKSVR